MGKSPFENLFERLIKFVPAVNMCIYMCVCACYMSQDAEHQMILVARRSLVAKVARHQTPQIDIFFLNINVRRNYLVPDSLKEVSLKYSLSPAL